MRPKQYARGALRLLGAKLRGGRFPLQAHVRVIDSCNLRCAYCFGDYPVRGTPPPSTKQLSDLMDGLGRLGTIRITLTGGEPLLRDDIVEVTARAVERGMGVSLTSNGILMEKRLDLLPLLDQLTVSLDGDRSVHDANRGEGSWGKAVHAIELAREKGTPVQLLCTVNRETTVGLRDVFHLADRYECSVTFDILAPLYGASGGMTPREQAASDERIREIIAGISRENQHRLVLSKSVLKYIKSWPFGYARYRVLSPEIPGDFKPIPCSAGRFFAIVETDGSLYPCCRIDQAYPAPNAYRLGIEEAWRRMPPHNCAACCSAGFSMFNALMAWEPGSIFHLLK